MMQKNLPDTFAVFILTHGRPNNVVTMKTLDAMNYSGRRYLVVDDEDKSLPEYIARFGESAVQVFSKKEQYLNSDSGNNFDDRRAVMYARNACFSLASTLGVTNFLLFEDDYNHVWYEVYDAHKRSVPVTDFNSLCALMLSFYNSINAHAIAFAQSGDFLGGLDNGKGLYRFHKRKCMNSFFCSTYRSFKFFGVQNDDVNTYCTLGSRGVLFLTIPNVSVNQVATQKSAGGMSAFYLRYGTYCKAFTTVMMMPSAVKVSMMQSNNPRIHHRIDWSKCVPCIVPEKFKKY